MTATQQVTAAQPVKSAATPPVSSAAAQARIDPRMRQALAIAGLLSLTAAVQLFAAGASDGGPPLRAVVVLVLANWLVALAIWLVAVRRGRAATDPGARTRRPRPAQVILLVVLLAPFMIPPALDRFSNGPELLASVPPTAFALWMVHRMQRYRRMPAWLVLAAFGWGATAAIGFVGATHLGFVNYGPALLRDAGSSVEQMQQWYATSLFVHVGVFEELGKAAGVAIAYVLLRRHVDGVVSGIVLGAAVGLGFNFSETIGHMSSANVPEYQYWVRQSVGLMAAHTAFSGLVGAGFGVARQLRERRLRRVVITCGFLVAAGGHFAANTINHWFNLGKDLWFAPSPTLDVFILTPLQLAVVQGPLVVMYLLLLRRGLRSQAAGLAVHLPAEARTGLGAITRAEVAVLLNPKQRLWLRVTMLRRHGISAYRNLNRLHAAQLDLATQRWHRARQEVDPWAPNERALRERVLDLKDSLATLMGPDPEEALT